MDHSLLSALISAHIEKHRNLGRSMACLYLTAALQQYGSTSHLMFWYDIMSHCQNTIQHIHIGPTSNTKIQIKQTQSILV